MSHIVTIQTAVRDPVAIQAACRRLALPAPVEGTTRLFSGEAHGWAVALPGWRYPLVCNPQEGTLRYDIFEGRWGAPEELHRFLQSYAVEKTRIEARRRGHTVTEQALADGSIKLTLTLGGSA